MFQLPEIPELPEVSNLMESPIPELVVKYDNDLREAMTMGSGLQWQAFNSGHNIPKSRFPITLSATRCRWSGRRAWAR